MTWINTALDLLQTKIAQQKISIRHAIALRRYINCYTSTPPPSATTICPVV